MSADYGYRRKTIFRSSVHSTNKSIVEKQLETHYQVGFVYFEMVIVELKALQQLSRTGDT